MGSGKSKETKPKRESAAVNNNTRLIQNGNNINNSRKINTNTERSTKNNNGNEKVNGTREQNHSNSRTHESEDIVQNELDLDSNWNYPNTIANNTPKKTVYRGNHANNNWNNNNNSRNTIPQEQEQEMHYPETYAQKNLREHYTKTGLLRQKTIYKDPDEWDQNDDVSFTIT